MQLVTRKIGHLAFEHQDEFKGDVKITKGDVSMTVPMDAIRQLAALSEQHRFIEDIRGMKPEELLRRGLLKKIA
jgi:hypothetical protein